MTKSEAKELSLEVWEHLRDCPEIDSKLRLPSELYDKIEPLRDHCPLCDCLERHCYNCPLKYCGPGSDFYVWCNSEVDDKTLRQKAAANIVEKIEDWEF